MSNECDAPFKIQRNDILGRCLVATRDIQPGEIITESPPMILGPKMASTPLCLGCHKKLNLNETRYDCSKCHWPLCAKGCEASPLHEAECEAFSKASFRPTIKSDNSRQSIYCSIAPLRALLLKSKSPEKFKLLLDFQSHVKEHQATRIYQILKQNLVPFFTQVLNIDTNEEEILTICSIFDTNCFDIRDPQGVINIRGLFPVISFMSHDCRHNTSHFFHIDGDFRLVLKATTLIKKGDLITTTYTQTLWGTLTRRSHLKMAKHFDCVCDRCKDPTELGTYLGAINCSACGDGSKVISSDPLDPKADWRCEKCHHCIPGDEMICGDEVLTKEVAALDKTNPKNLEDFLEKYQEVLHGKNSYCLQVKFALCQMYGNELSPKLIDRKIQFCQELIEIADILEPDYSKFRGLMLYELYETLVAKAKRKGEGVEEDTIGYLREAAEILKWEPDMKDLIEEKMKEL